MKLILMKLIKIYVNLVIFDDLYFQIKKYLNSIVDQEN